MIACMEERTDSPDRPRETLADWPNWCAAFLDELGRSGSPRAAADVAQIGRESAYQFAKRHPDFRALWAEARSRSIGRLERKVRKWAGDGWIETEYEFIDGQRVPVKAKHKRSPNLAMQVLAAELPSKYGRKSVAPSVTVNVGIVQERQARMLADPAAMEAAATLAALMTAPQSPPDALSAPLGQIIEGEPAGPQEGN